MNLEENKKIVIRYYEEVWNQGNIDLIDELFDPDYVVHNLAPWRKPGTEGLKEFIVSNHKIFPDIHWEIVNIVAEGDKVAVHLTATGTQEEELNGPLGVVPASGKKATWQAFFINRIVDGKIVEVWGFPDNMSLMKQLGALNLK